MPSQGRPGARRTTRTDAHPYVGEIRGLGLIAAVELVEDKATKQPFDPAREMGKRLQRMVLERGVILRAIGDTIAMSPPLSIGEQEVDEIVDALSRAIDQLFAEL